MKAVKKIEISVLHKRTMPLVVYTMQGDTGREIECTVADWDIPTDATARVWVVKPSKKVVYDDCRIVENTVVFSLTNQMLAEPGVAICIIEFDSGEDVVSSFPFNLCIDGSARGDGIPSENESTVLEGMFEALGQDAIKALDAAKAEAAAANKSAQDTEKIKNDFTLTAQQAVADVNNAGQTQTQRVNTAGDTQVSCIQAEGTTQVQNVQATAAEIAADREQIHTNRDNTARLQRISAGAITRSAEGSFITLEDAADGMGFRQLEIPGETRQVTTTGAQLIDFEQCLKNWKSQYTQVGGRVYKITALGSGYQAPISFSTEDTKVTLSGNVRDISGSGYRIDLIDSAGNIVGRINKDIKSVTGLASKIRLNFAESGAGEYSDIMLNAGDTALPWEPYTGAAPSPSPEHPQEMKNVGKLNEQTGKYEVTITSCSRNLLDMSGAKGGTSSGISSIVNPDGTVRSNGTFSDKTINIWFLGNYAKPPTSSNTIITLLPGMTYFVNDVVLYFLDNDGTGQAIEGKYTVDANVYPDGIKVTGARHVSVKTGTTLTNKIYYPRVLLGDKDTGWEPYRGHTATITADRPLTKWDKLTCRDGVWGWAYGGAICRLTGTSEIKSVGQYAYSIPGKMLKHSHISCSHYPYSGKEINDDSVLTYMGTGFFIWIYDRRFSDKVENTFDIDGFKTFLTECDTSGTPVTACYQLATEEWVPLSAAEQAAMNALCSYAGTTHIWTDDPLQPVISLDYTVDTVKYIGALEDRIAALETAQAQTTAAFSYLPPEIQAAMIENETRDLLSTI
ncbi:hypothetical protein [Blautia pseudococcoides]|uniref:BppU N-terminal domain-containing protein n=2 Tax=Blautia pseudococcoides TaxID=1796616 RepID=A0A1C7I4E7_9FIRM|nr:hypothetical protein [Blautia pseudococcoides]WAK79271.1 minor tail protein [Blautia phage Montmirail]ANU74445.1 hypothetical protein A4V09_00820 [Blautia pseudococcoides]ASU31436.1 hypothetical protein ADH70_023195 [Blautia pseudococcoides]QJU15506.1 hypothetical protein HL650_14305 [Blautia pseudococcoides]QQQ91981.1 hypothetical protein I5Q86_16915 [Blautia pseudococcoides]